MNQTKEISPEYLGLVDRLWNRYILGAKPFDAESLIAEGLREGTARSWARSVSAGVDPLSTIDAQCPPEKLDALKKENRSFLEIAVPHIETLFSSISGSNYIVQLCEKNGCVLKCLYDTDLVLNMASAISHQEDGYLVTEEEIGTGSTGLCAFLKKPVQIVGAEHFQKRNHCFSCSSSPVFDPQGNLLGVVTVMCERENYSLHTLGMACATANGIEKEFRLRMTNRVLSTALDAISSGVAILDADNRVLMHNEMFDAVLKLPHDEINNADIFSLLDRSSFPEELADLKQEHGLIEVSIRNKYNEVRNVLFSVRKVQTDAGSVSTMLTFESQKSIHELANKLTDATAKYRFDDIIGKSAETQELKRTARQMARSGSTVLILGESGTGKELLAQSIHNASDRAAGPFISINCGAIPKDLIASELFGSEQGAFTGAKKGGNPGKFELANHGTLFLDEIGDMPLALQTTLLRVLQEREVTRLGGNAPKKIDVRIIAATNRNLLQEIENHTFRADLYYRLNVLTLRTAPLRMRQGDIPELAAYFIKKYSASLNRPNVISLSQDALQALLLYDWPGNIRELENTMERAVNITVKSLIGLEQLPENIAAAAQTMTVDAVYNPLSGSLQYTAPAAAAASAPTALNSTGSIPSSTFAAARSTQAAAEVHSPEIAEYQQLTALLTEERGHAKTVAIRLGLPVSTLYAKLKKYNLNAKDFKKW